MFVHGHTSDEMLNSRVKSPERLAAFDARKTDRPGRVRRRYVVQLLPELQRRLARFDGLAERIDDDGFVVVARPFKVDDLCPTL
jgi:hypothetical protein